MQWTRLRCICTYLFALLLFVIWFFTQYLIPLQSRLSRTRFPFCIHCSHSFFFGTFPCRTRCPRWERTHFFSAFVQTLCTCFPKAWKVIYYRTQLITMRSILVADLGLHHYAHLSDFHIFLVRLFTSFVLSLTKTFFNAMPEISILACWMTLNIFISLFDLSIHSRFPVAV